MKFCRICGDSFGEENKKECEVCGNLVCKECAEYKEGKFCCPRCSSNGIPEVNWK